MIFLVYSTPPNKVTAKMMLYKNTKSLVRSPKWDTNFFDNKAVPFRVTSMYLFSVINLDYVLRTSLNKHHNLQHPSQYRANKLIDIDYTNDLASTADTITNATYLLYNLENAANEFGQ